MDFQNYAEWCNQQPNFGKKGFAVDKDLTLIGNKVYCPEYCNVIPRQINSLVKDSLKDKHELPTGVFLNVYYQDKEVKLYEAVCGTGKGKLVKIGSYPCPKQAQQAYMEFKRKVVREVVEEYKEYLTEKIIFNLLNYEF